VDNIGHKELKVRHKETGREVKVVPPVKYLQKGGKTGVEGLDVSSGGLGVSSAGDVVEVWDTETGTVRRKLEGHLGQVYTARLFPSGLVLLSGGGDMRLRVTSVEDGRCPVVLVGHTGSVTDTAIIDRGKLVISISRDGTVRLWKVGEAKCIANIASLGQALSCCSLINSQNSPFNQIVEKPEPGGADEEGTKGLLLAVGGEDGLVVVLDVASRKEVWRTILSSPVSATTHSSSCLWFGCEDGSLHTVTCTKDQGVTLTVETHSPSAILSLLHTSQLGLVVARREGTVTLYSPRGLRVELTSCTDTPVTGLAADSTFLYTITKDGSIATYSLDILKLIE